MLLSMPVHAILLTRMDKLAAKERVISPLHIYPVSVLTGIVACSGEAAVP